MAIAFDTYTSSGGSGSTSSFSFSHTCSGSDRILFVTYSAADTGNANPSTTVTYNGVSMTSLVNYRPGGASNPVRIRVFYLLNPASGSNTVSVTLGSGWTFFSNCAAASYTGVDQTTGVEASQTVETSGSATATISVTTLTNNAVVAAFLGNRQGRTLTISSPSTQRGNQGTYPWGDRTTTTAGSYSVVWTSSDGDIDSASVAISIKPTTAPTFNPTMMHHMQIAGGLM